MKQNDVIDTPPYIPLHDVSSIRIGRLRRLAKYLKKVDPDKLIMEYFVTSNTRGLGNFTKLVPGCDLALCMLGWAGVIPEFQDKGLKTSLKRGSVSLKLTDKELARVVKEHPHWIEGTVRNCYLSGFEAGAQFFGLSIQQAQTLFAPGPGHTTPDEVIKNLDTFIQQVELKRATY